MNVSAANGGFRSPLSDNRHSGFPPKPAVGASGEWEQFAETCDWMSVDHACQHIAYPGKWLDPFELGRFDQGRHDGPPVGAARAACEESILTAERDRSNDPLHRIGVEIYAPVLDKPRRSSQRFNACGSPLPVWR